MKKKLTLRLLTALMVIMTAVAFMPITADAVWAEGEEVIEPEGEQTTTPSALPAGVKQEEYDVWKDYIKAGHREDTDGDGKHEWVIDVGCGNVAISGQYITYYEYDMEPSSLTYMEIVPVKKERNNQWEYELVLTGKTPSTYFEGMKDEGTGNVIINQDTGKAATKSNTPGPSKIVINNGSGNTHRVTFENLNMSPGEGNLHSYAAVTLNSGAEPEITLAGDNNIVSRYAPAISVHENAKLTLQEQSGETGIQGGSITASTSGGDSAGIGGVGESGYFGNITIKSGTIDATGCGMGAGIGGSGTGSGNISITGGTIKAKGGNSYDSNSSNLGAHGIGNGATGSTNGGSISITSGTVDASGGMGSQGVAAAGIASQKLSSDNNTIVLSSTEGVIDGSPDGDFSAVVWTDSDKKSATIYGDVLLVNENENGEYNIEGVPEKCQPVNLGSATVKIPEGSSITSHPDAGTYLFSTTDEKAKLMGEGTLTGNFQGYESLGPKKTVSLRLGYNVGKNGIEAGDPGQHEYIHVIGLDTKKGSYKEFNGKGKKLIGDLITMKNTTTSGELLEGASELLKGEPGPWTITVRDQNGNLITDHNQIINAGYYTLTFSHIHGYSDPFTIEGVRILPKQLEDCDIEMEEYYDYGADIEYTITDDDTGKELVPGTDYEVKFYECDEHGDVDYNSPVDIEDPDDMKVGYYAAVFSTANLAKEGNYTTRIDINDDGKLDEDKPLIIPFAIEPADITGAEISGFKKTYTYNGKQHVEKDDIEVSLNGKEIDPDEYEIVFSNSSLTGSASQYTDKQRLTCAGVVTITIIANDVNYTGEATGSFEIQKKSIGISEVTAAYPSADGTGWVNNRPYDGTNIVNITKVTLDTRNNAIVKGDDVTVALEGLTEDTTDDLTGTLSGADAKDYYEVSLKNVRLKGDDAFNYEVKDDTWDLGPQQGNFDVFIITPLVVDKPLLTDNSVSFKSSSGDSEKFQGTVKVDNQPAGATYVYAVSDTADADLETLDWQTSDTFDRLTSNTEYWFYAKIDPKNTNLKAKDESNKIGVVKKKTPLIPQEPPEDFQLEITLDPNGETYTVTIPEQEGAQYSFDGTNYTKSNVKKKVGPNVEVTGYARFPATKTHAISQPTTATDTTPPLTVKTPVISPEDGAFYGSVQVTITCATKDATIYYTLDGNYPTESDSVYRGPITITEDTTVTAVAVKKDMNESELASVDYVYTEFPPQSKSSLTKGVKVTNDLKNSAYSQKDSITAALSRAITEDGGGYTYQNIAYYDLNLQLSFDGGKTYVKADAENFPEEGVEITVKTPSGTGTSTHDFRVAHMFSETSDRLGIAAGEIEKPDVTENGEGLTFTVTGCSPLAIGWVETEDGAAAGDDEDKDEDANASAGENADTLNAEGQTGSADGDAANAAGGTNVDGANGAGGANADGTGADGGNADGEDANGQGGAGGVVDELVNAVTTGDYTNPYFWAAIAIVSLLLIIIITAATRRRRT